MLRGMARSSSRKGRGTSSGTSRRKVARAPASETTTGARKVSPLASRTPTARSPSTRMRSTSARMRTEPPAASMTRVAPSAMRAEVPDG